jgi:hypothetical protein
MTDLEKQNSSRRVIENSSVGCPIKPKQYAYIAFWFLGAGIVAQLLQGICRHVKVLGIQVAE